MPFRRKDQAAAPDRPVADSLPVRILKAVTSVSLALLFVAIAGLIFAPRDPGTLTLYGLVIGLNLLLFLLFWPIAKWLQRLDR